MNTNLKALVVILATLNVLLISVGVAICLPTEVQLLFKDSGVIGDTLGGISAPILNFGGMIVLYLTLREQLNNNDMQKDALDHERNKSSHEKLLILTEREIKAAGREMSFRKESLKTMIENIRNFDSILSENLNLPADLYDEQREALIQSIMKVEGRLATAAGLLAKVHSTLSKDDFPKEYLAYCFDLFHENCTQVILLFIVPNNLPEPLSPEQLPYTNYLIWAVREIETRRRRYYKNVVRAEMNNDNTYWKQR